jgi:hypothetical protein
VLTRLLSLGPKQLMRCKYLSLESAGESDRYLKIETSKELLVSLLTILVPYLCQEMALPLPR